MQDGSPHTQCYNKACMVRIMSAEPEVHRHLNSLFRGSVTDVMHYKTRPGIPGNISKPLAPKILV